MNLLQRDIEINRISTGNKPKYEYQLIVLSDPCKSVLSDKEFDFGLVNITAEGSANMELYKNSESVSQSDLEDPQTFIIPITINT